MTPSRPQSIDLVWFRDDLRLSDHPALAAAAGQPLACLYVLDEASPGVRPLGGAARWWLAGSLRALATALRERGAQLILRRGAAAQIVPAVAEELGARSVLWNRRYDVAGIAVDAAAEAALTGRGIGVRTFPGSVLREPQAVANKAGKPFGVFTPFWRHVRTLGAPRAPIAAPAKLNGLARIASDQLEDWKLEPTAPDWADGLRVAWTHGESNARARLTEFIEVTLPGYAVGRERPDLDKTSRLSPHLRFGEISPVEVLHAVELAEQAPRSARPAPADAEKFLSELGWREFSYHLLHHHPDLARRNLQPRFDAFPWRSDPHGLAAWQRGETGYPMVDAGMRQLWATGWMHNRVRMIAASFLIKHLSIDWRTGEQWFWDTLVDADPANNAASWQWVAGSGADAAPYFRIFNPVAQGEKFDPSGGYIRKWIPELAHLPNDSIHAPFAATPIILATAGVSLGKTYPYPIVEHRAARERALAAFATLKDPPA